MAIEIERKFLVNENKLPSLIQGHHLIQGYLFNQKEKSLRVRIKDDRGYITIKSGTDCLTRSEFEYEIPLKDAKEMILLCGNNLIDKHRYLVPHKQHIWEIDIFHGDNQGLIIAEIELKHPDENFILPPWIDREVTQDPRYINASLVQLPYSQWE